MSHPIPVNLSRFRNVLSECGWCYPGVDGSTHRGVCVCVFVYVCVGRGGGGATGCALPYATERRLAPWSVEHIHVGLMSCS